MFKLYNLIIILKKNSKFPLHLQSYNLIFNQRLITFLFWIQTQKFSNKKTDKSWNIYYFEKCLYNIIKINNLFRYWNV